MRFTIQNKIPALISFLFFADDASEADCDSLLPSDHPTPPPLDSF